MSTIIFLALFFAFFVGLLNWLPEADVANSLFTTSFTYFFGVMKGWNWFFPILELFYCLGIIVAYEVIMWTWFHVLVPTAKMIRGSTH